MAAYGEMPAKYSEEIAFCKSDFRLEPLTRPRKSVIVEPLQIDHASGNEILFLSLLEKPPLVQNSHFDERIDVFGGELFLREILLVLHVTLALLVARVFAHVAVFVAAIHRRRLLFILGELARRRLFFDEPRRESVGVCHVLMKGDRVGIYRKNPLLQFGRP